MNVVHDLAYFFGGAFLSNAVPHFVSGVLGRPFQSPFATPPGRGLSSATVNVLWGFFNIVAGFLLIGHVGSFDWRATDQIVATGLGVCLMGLMAARHFGRLHGGDLSAGTRAPVNGTFARCAASIIGYGRPARSCRTSARGCSVRRRTGSSSHSSRITTPRPWASSWRCNTAPICCCSR